MSEQIARKNIAYLLCLFSCLSKCQTHSILLKAAFRFFPGVAAEHVVLSHHIKKKAERTLAFFFAYYGGISVNINRLIQPDTLFSLPKLCTHTIPFPAFLFYQPVLCKLFPLSIP